MKYQVLVSDKAVHDVIRNARWWADNHSAEEAYLWEQAIFRKIYALDQFPESHPLAHENPEFPYELREAHFGLGSVNGGEKVWRRAGDP